MADCGALDAENLEEKLAAKCLESPPDAKADCSASKADAFREQLDVEGREGSKIDAFREQLDIEGGEG